MSNWQTKGYVPDSEGEDDDDFLETQTEDEVEVQTDGLPGFTIDTNRRQPGIVALDDVRIPITPQSASRQDQDTHDLSIYDFPSDNTPTSTSVTKRKSGSRDVLTTNNDVSEDNRILKKAKVRGDSPLDHVEPTAQRTQPSFNVVGKSMGILGVEQVELVCQCYIHLITWHLQFTCRS